MMGEPTAQRAFALGIVLALGGIAFLGGGLWSWVSEKQREHWPKAPGRLLSVSLVQVDHARRTIEATRSLRPTEAAYVREAAWIIQVEYEFTVAGQTLHGDRLTHPLWFADATDSQAPPPDMIEAEAQLRATLAKGEVVNVYHQTERPQESFLLHRPGIMNRRAMALGAALLAVGVGLAGWAKARAGRIERA